MKKLVVCFGFLTVLNLFLAEKAIALNVTVYQDIVSFNTAAGQTSVYDFESDPVGPGYQIYDFGPFSVNGSGVYEVKIEDSNTHELYFVTSNYIQNLALQFDSPVTAAGFDWANIDNNTDELRVIFDGTTYILGSKGESGFFGIVATEGQIDSSFPLLLGDTDGGAGWLAATIDNVRYVNPVPEPGSLLLLGSGLIGLVGLRRKLT